MKHQVVKHGLDIGDLVKMRVGYSEPGLLIELLDRSDGDVTRAQKWARVLWPDHGMGIEKVRDLVTVT